MDTSAAAAEAMPASVGDAGEPGAPAARGDEEVPGNQTAVEADEALALARALAAELEVRVSWGVPVVAASLPRGCRGCCHHHGVDSTSAPFSVP